MTGMQFLFVFTIKHRDNLAYLTFTLLLCEGKQISEGKFTL
jgi:hypothetical protein